MSYPSYLEYRGSGLDWPPQIPSHWRTAKFKHLAQIKNGRDYKEVEEDDGPYPVIGSGGEFARAKNYLYEGESVLLGRKGTVDKPLYVNGAFWTVDTMFYTYLGKNTSGRFLYYLATTISFDRYSTNTALPSMAQEDLANIQVVAPDLGEQTQIARFLDHQTARIDALIAEQQRLIELLKEKRQAVISHAVTKGLDPDVAMKDSEVEWLGAIPEHWGITRLKYASEVIVDCPHETPSYDPEGDFFVIRTADIENGVLDPKSMYRLNEHEYSHRIRREPVFNEDIVYGREGARWGHAAIVPESGRYALGQRMMQIRPANHMSSNLLMWMLNSRNVYRQGEVDIVGAASPHVNFSTIINYTLAYPPLSEQERIAQFLEETTGGYDSLIAQAEDTTNLLYERRSALISGAVTGRIDVRDWAPPASETFPQSTASEEAPA